MIIALVSVAFAGPLSECSQTWSAVGLRDVVESADLSMGQMDTAGFLAARDLLLVRLGCVNEPLSGAIAGGVHRVVATAALLEKQDARIAPALAGLLAADPGYQLPVALYPDGHPIRGLLSHASLLVRDPGARPLAVPASGWLEADGLSAAVAPTARAAVIQQIDGQGAVVETRYVWPGDALGSWAPPDLAPAPTVVAGAPEPTRRTLPRTAAGARPARVPLIVATAASVVATGVLYGVARDRYDAFWDPTVTRPPDEAEALAGTTNALTVGWMAAGVASVGLGVGLAFAW